MGLRDERVGVPGLAVGMRPLSTELAALMSVLSEIGDERHFDTASDERGHAGNPAQVSPFLAEQDWRSRSLLVRE